MAKEYTFLKTIFVHSDYSNDLGLSLDGILLRNLLEKTRRQFEKIDTFRYNYSNPTAGVIDITQYKPWRGKLNKNEGIVIEIDRIIPTRPTITTITKWDLEGHAVVNNMKLYTTIVSFLCYAKTPERSRALATAVFDWLTFFKEDVRRDLFNYIGDATLGKASPIEEYDETELVGTPVTVQIIINLKWSETLPGDHVFSAIAPFVKL